MSGNISSRGLSGAAYVDTHVTDAQVRAGSRGALRKMHTTVVPQIEPTRVEALPPHRAPSIAADWMEDLVWADVRAFLENPGVVLERLRSEGIDTDSSLIELETRRDD